MRLAVLVCLGFFVLSHVGECRGTDDWPVELQGFWRVKRSILLEKNGDGRQSRSSRDILILNENKVIQVNTNEDGFPGAVVNEVVVRPHGEGRLAGTIKLPTSFVADTGRNLDEHEEFILEVKVSRVPKKLELTMRFGDEIVRHEAVKQDDSRGARQLGSLLRSDFFCKPELRDLLLSLVDRYTKEDG